jgi:hypothetical protein
MTEKSADTPSARSVQIKNVMKRIESRDAMVKITLCFNGYSPS